MKVKDLLMEQGFVLVCGDAERQLTGVYCCDLLSWAMGRAPADCAWVTVMGNTNAMAVSLLADCGCVVLAEGVSLDADALAKAQQQDLTVLASEQPIFETALAIHRQLVQPE